MPLTILVAGSPGTGKTSLCDAFAGTRLADRVRRKKSIVVYSAGRPAELKITQHTIDGPNDEVEYNLLDVHNFGGSIDSYEDIERLTQYLEDRFNEMVAEQSRIRRNPKFVDKRIHACVYMLDSFHGLREFDQVAMTRLSTLTNVVPVIGRAESFTLAELDQLRGRLMADFSAYKIPVFQFQDSDKEQPLRVVRTNEYDEHGNTLLSLKLPFGRLDATDPEVSDFVTLREYLLDTYIYELIDHVVDILYEQYRTIRLSDPNGRYSVLEPEMLASHASRLKQEQLERESRELREQEERIQKELEQRRRDLQERERELKQLEEQLALERAVLDRRNRRLSDIDENEAVTTPQQLQKEFSGLASTPPTNNSEPEISHQPGSTISISGTTTSSGSGDSAATVVAHELRHSRSVHISPVQRNERPLSEASSSSDSMASAEYTDFHDIKAKGQSPAWDATRKEASSVPVAPVITERVTSVGSSAKTGPVLKAVGQSAVSSAGTATSSVYSAGDTSSAGSVKAHRATSTFTATPSSLPTSLRLPGAPTGAPSSAPPSASAPAKPPSSAPMSAPPGVPSSAPLSAPPSAPSSAPPSAPSSAPPSAPSSAPPSAPSQRLKPSVMPPPSPPFKAQKSFIAHPSVKDSEIYGAHACREESLSHASLVTAPDLNPSSSTLDSMPGSFPGVKGVNRKASSSSMNRRSSVIDSVPSGYETPPVAGLQGYGRPGNTSGSSLDTPDSPSYPPRSPNRPNSFIALDQTLVQPRK